MTGLCNSPFRVKRFSYLMCIIFKVYTCKMPFNRKYQNITQSCKFRIDFYTFNRHWDVPKSPCFDSLKGLRYSNKTNFKTKWLLQFPVYLPFQRIFNMWWCFRWNLDHSVRVSIGKLAYLIDDTMI